MTCIVLEYDAKSKILRYSSAGHEAPALYDIGRELTKKEIEFLPLPPSMRLGDRAESSFQNHSLQLHGPKGLLIYSDGVLDLQNPAADVFGERRMLKALTRIAHSQSQSTQGAVEAFTESLRNFRNEQHLADDVSFLFATLF